jgi:hypothetical protein
VSKKGNKKKVNELKNTMVVPLSPGALFPSAVMGYYGHFLFKASKEH